MCGIAGYYGTGDRNILERMSEALCHRGPDGKGFFVKDNIGLAHRRLSIIDLSVAASQPMANEAGDVQLVFNGEIYNFKELREELSNCHNFKSGSDTEVIIHLYEEIGLEVFSKIQGMFAIALYDLKSRKLILARDRMGKKPLYWSLADKTLIFASELKALLQHPAFKKELDLRSLNKYLFYEYVPTPSSIFKKTYKLEPGHYLVFDGVNIIKNKYWDISFSRQDLKLSPEEALIGLDKRMNDAVAARLVSDVPLGIFLSGGIDSSSIAYYAQKNSFSKIKTFSIGFEDKSFDESKYARQIAKFLSTEHYEKILTAKDSLDLIPRIGDLLDEPMADASIIPTYLLASFTKQKVTVALGGDGGDELFCGYDTFVAERMAELYEKLPDFFRKNIIEKAVASLPTSFSNISFDFKAKRFISGFYEDKKHRQQIWLGSFGRVAREKLFMGDVWRSLAKENEFEEVDNYLQNLGGESHYNQLIYLYLRTYLMDDILVKVDRASMYNSLEVRSPLLDTELVDFVNGLPLDWKLKGFTTKYLFKKLLTGKLPKDIVWRKKKGFGIPLASWLSKELKTFTLDLLGEARIKQQGLFDYAYINKLLEDHFSCRADNRKLIWSLIVFQLWHEKWLGSH